ncbi:MAG TPA: hypothetical protein VL357_03250 [Rariglobus sp.]|jgi:hypothetical protein|nr:hypothetical protein [Rariglobus sp.]
MNSFYRHLSIAGLLCFLGNITAFAIPSTAYLETMPVTITWQFNITGVGKTRVAQPIASSKTIDNPPDPVGRTTTETGAPIIYTAGNGDQAFFVQQLLRKVLENYAESSRTLLLNNDPSGAQSYEDEIAYLKQQVNDQWELTAVRAPQTSIDGVLNSPYWIFLSKIDSLDHRVLKAYDTGMRITPKYNAGSLTENLVNGQPANVSGSMITYFTLDFYSLYANDPLYLVPFASRAAATDGTTYNSAGSEWGASGSGYITYSFRKTSGTSGVIAPTKIKITGVGSWYNTLFNNTDASSKTFGGTAPLKIALGEVLYQNSTFFPEYTP